MRIGMAQLLVEGGEPERNLARAKILIERAVAEGAELVLLPETLDVAWTHPSAYTEATTIPGERSDYFCAIAKSLKVWLCLGLTELRDGKTYNSALLIDDNGKIVHTYSKINLLEVEFPFYTPGQQLSVVDTPFGKIGINICADNYIDSLHIAHALARMNAQIILSPSSWTVDHSITEEIDPYNEKWIQPLHTIATLYEIPFVSVTSVGYIVGGPYEGKKMVGCSLAVDKHGIITQGAYNEFAGDVTVIDLELGNLPYKGVQYGAMAHKKGK